MFDLGSSCETIFIGMAVRTPLNPPTSMIFKKFDAANLQIIFQLERMLAIFLLFL